MWTHGVYFNNQLNTRYPEDRYAAWGSPANNVNTKTYREVLNQAQANVAAARRRYANSVADVVRRIRARDPKVLAWYDTQMPGNGPYKNSARPYSNKIIALMTQYGLPLRHPAPPPNFPYGLGGNANNARRLANSNRYVYTFLVPNQPEYELKALALLEEAFVAAAKAGLPNALKHTPNFLARRRIARAEATRRRPGLRGLINNFRRNGFEGNRANKALIANANLAARNRRVLKRRG